MWSLIGILILVIIWVGVHIVMWCSSGYKYIDEDGKVAVGAIDVIGGIVLLVIGIIFNSHWVLYGFILLVLFGLMILSECLGVGLIYYLTKEYKENVEKKC